MWRVIKRMYEYSKSAVLLDGERLEAFGVDQGVAQGCSLSPILFSVFINGLLREVEEAEIGIDLSGGGRLGGLLFADDFVGDSETKDQLQSLIDVVHAYCRKWRLKANVSKSAVMVFSGESVVLGNGGSMFCLEPSWVLINPRRACEKMDNVAIFLKRLRYRDMA